jgi:hypothetical protein
MLLINGGPFLVKTDSWGAGALPWMVYAFSSTKYNERVSGVFSLSQSITWRWSSDASSAIQIPVIAL